MYVDRSSCAATNPATVSYNNLVANLHTFEVRAVDTRDNKDPTRMKFSYSDTRANGTTSHPYKDTTKSRV